MHNVNKYNNKYHSKGILYIQPVNATYELNKSSLSD